MIEVRIPSGVASGIAAMGRFASERGWVPATSGNFSCRIDARTIAITRSGVDKGSLAPLDVLAVALDAPVPPGVSAETPLHAARYLHDPDTGAIAHVHSIAATVLSRVDAQAGAVTVQGYEMQKALSGVTTHEGRLVIPIFGNAQDTRGLAERIEDRIGATPQVPAYLLAGHGMYVWGATVDDTLRHLQGLEFLLCCALEERKIRA